MSIIKVENLSKKYIIGHDRQAAGMFRYQSMRDSMAHAARGIYQRLRHPLSPNQESTELEEFWALKDINFEIQQGERVGIIGRNGAGKSTLLKILSRITEPTTGKIHMGGRVASLLEVGTGFHPELSGRENIYLNGAILGMTSAEIKRKFDEIIAFAEVEKFLDTPVKHYSSGMYVRLAFAVAAHLEPEILLVDEVLAVGDAQFQKKCLGKMEDVSKEGRTILFVSHNMSAVTSLCQKGVWLDCGQIRLSGKIESVISEYINSQSSVTHEKLETRRDRKGSGEICFTSIKAQIDAPLVYTGPASGSPVVIELELKNRTARDFRDLRINVSVDDFMMQRVTAFSNRLTNCKVDIMANGHGRVVIKIDRMPLIAGRYYINLLCEHNGTILDLIYRASLFDVTDGHFFKDDIIDEISCNFGVCMIAHKMIYSVIT